MPRRSFWAWVAVATPCTVLMWMLPGSETVPYHIAWAAFALCFGLEVWAALETWLALGLFTVVTGAILVYRVAAGVLNWQEGAEIPLMLLLMALMVVHVRRRQGAIAALTAVHERERGEAESRDLLTRRTAHEMRSPLTIACGYVEILEDRHAGTESGLELHLVSDELRRLTRVCERLVRSLRAQQEYELELVDLDALLARTRNAWAAVADRDWLVSADVGAGWCAPERLRACLDTLVENAIRYTHPGDTIELYGLRTPDMQVSVGVSDSGPGFSADVRTALLAGVPAGVAGPQAFSPQPRPSGIRLRGPADLGAYEPAVGSPHHPEGFADALGDELSQTGLGLGLVEEVVRRRGGRIEIGTSRWGGARVGFVWPAVAPV